MKPDGLIVGAWTLDTSCGDAVELESIPAQLRAHEPIEFTYSWVRHFDFSPTDNQEVWGREYEDRLGMKKTFRIIMVGNIGCWVVVEDPANGIGVNLGYFKYVHEVQLIYYALTGKHL